MRFHEISAGLICLDISRGREWEGDGWGGRGGDDPELVEYFLSFSPWIVQCRASRRIVLQLGLDNIIIMFTLLVTNIVLKVKILESGFAPPPPPGTHDRKGALSSHQLKGL